MRGRPEQAAVLYGASESILQTLGAKLQPADKIEVDQYLLSIHEQLDDKLFEKSMAIGKEMSFEQAVSFALDDQTS